MKLLVVSSCTRDKDDRGCPKAAKLKIPDFDDPVRLRRQERELSHWVKPAAKMYTGRQHTQMMDGVRDFRSTFGDDTCDVAIVSAGYGLITEDRPIAPYDITFQGMPKAFIRERGDKLGIPSAIRKAVINFPVVFFLLGDDYLRSACPPLPPANGQKFLALGSPKLRLVPNSDVIVVPAAQKQCPEFGSGVVALKGQMFRLFASGLKARPKLWNGLVRDETPETLLELMRLGKQHG